MDLVTSQVDEVPMRYLLLCTWAVLSGVPRTSGRDRAPCTHLGAPLSLFPLYVIDLLEVLAVLYLGPMGIEMVVRQR